MAEYRGCLLPEDLYYDLDYVWLRQGDDGLVTVGVTDPAQTMGGRIVAINVKKVGKVIAAGRHIATLESGKWIGGIPIPFSGTIEERNEALMEEPELVNVDPYGAAWLARIRPDDPASALQGLSTGEAAIEALRAWIDRYDLECMRCSK
ncbi:MAG: glycine cleavage system protein GcvH [Allgaiera sp.]|jgi:glycine cleavage system H protein|nr:glycine cleavage system protein GcvH [Allgaiera sp.]